MYITSIPKRERKKERKKNDRTISASITRQKEKKRQRKERNKKGLEEKGKYGIIALTVGQKTCIFVRNLGEELSTAPHALK